MLKLLILSLAAGVLSAPAGGCSDLESAQCCFDAHMDWRSSKDAFEEPTVTVVYYTTSYTRETYTDVFPTTLCDGFPRLREPLFGEYTTTTVSVEEPQTSYYSTLYPTPPPDCTINEQDCIPYMTDYWSSVTAYESDNSNPYPVSPPCTTYSACPGEGQGMCKIIPGDAKVYYWPVTMEGDLCGERTTVPHPEPTRTTVVDGATFTSPSIYLSLEHVRASSYAARYDATACGRHKTNVLISFYPTAVSTHWGTLKRNTMSYTQLNLADMNDPTPAAAYFFLTELPDCQATPASCTETIEPTYTPKLSAPMEQIRSLDPEYAFCELHPSLSSRIPGVTWVPLEPTQDGWPAATQTPEPEPEE